MSVPPGGGVLAIDKPSGPTSHDVVAMARRALACRRIGHTGTLDPFASGLLLLVVGRATRLSLFLTGMEKTYIASARLGIMTDTLDREGRVVAERSGWQDLTLETVRSALERFRGPLRQIPPAFSAKKVGGQVAHRLARRGEHVELRPVEVVVHELELLDLAPPTLSFRVRCSSGTYVRALARDLGEALECGAHLSELRRTRVGPFTAERAAPIEALDALPPQAWLDPIDALAAAELPRVHVGDDDARRLVHGQSVAVPESLSGVSGPVAVEDSRGLVAVAQALGAELRPRKVFRDATT